MFLLPPLPHKVNHFMQQLVQRPVAVTRAVGRESHMFYAIDRSVSRFGPSHSVCCTPRCDTWQQDRIPDAVRGLRSYFDPEKFAAAGAYRLAGDHAGRLAVTEPVKLDVALVGLLRLATGWRPLPVGPLPPGGRRWMARV
jgi:hypothetical protein